MLQPQPNQLTLISHSLCPYVQRAVIVLEELGLPYKRVDIDLNNKPEWFKVLSPLGKVPVLVVDDDVVLFESAVIAEYINDIGDSTLLSVASLDRARQRAWVEFASATLNNIGQLYNAPDEVHFNEVSQQLNAKWAMLEDNLPTHGFFAGERFSLVDAAFAPVFRYFDVFERFEHFGHFERKLELDSIRRYPKLAQWRLSLSGRESVRDAVSPEYPALLTQFLAKRDSYLGALAKSAFANT